MKQDTEKTKVLFLLEGKYKDEVFAYFPKEIHHVGDYATYNACYSHLGQHSSCNSSYARKCPKATPAQYNDLKRELEGIGYNLEILN